MEPVAKRNPEQTRQAILDAALAVIHAKGFQAASLSDILAETGLTRGALYHHFPNKRALGLAALEGIEQMVRRMWLEPLAGADDPLNALQGAITAAGASLSQEVIVLGCPLNNLAQEMSPSDEQFRRKVSSIYYQWRMGIASALIRGQEKGTVRADIDPEAAATFFVGALTGGRGWPRPPKVWIPWPRWLPAWPLTWTLCVPRRTTELYYLAILHTDRLVSTLDGR